MKCFAQRKHTEVVVWWLFLITLLQPEQHISTNSRVMHQVRQKRLIIPNRFLFRSQFCLVHTHLLFSPFLATHRTSSFICSLKSLLRFAKHRRLFFLYFLICCNETLCPIAKKGGTSKGLPLIWLQTVVVCAISVACSITMERFKCDPKVIRMALCEVQSLSHVTLIWCEVTTWDLYDLHWLSLLIWSVLSEIFKSMFKGSVQLCSLNPPAKVSFQWRAHGLTAYP